MSDKKEKKVKPVENTKVYSTAKLKGIYPVVGTEIEVHVEQAAKLIASGKATEKKPGKSKATGELQEESQDEPVK